MRPQTQRPSAKIRSCTIVVTVFLVLSAIQVETLSAQVEKDETKTNVEATRSTLEQWVQTRRLISKEKRDWNLGKELLSERIELVKQEIDAMKERIAKADESLSKLDKEKVELSNELNAFNSATESLSKSITPLEARITALLKRIPDPIRKKVEPLSSNIPAADKKDIKLSLGQRFQNVIGVLNQVNKFNGEISVFPETRDIGNGKTAEVSNLYIGISQGYFANDKATAAGIGTAVDGKWVWSPKNDSAKQISLAIKIMNDEEGASFVPLPLSVK